RRSSDLTVDMQHIDQLTAAGVPVVFFDRISDRLDTFQVGINNRDGAFRATQHLIDSGYRRIAMLNIGPGIYFAEQRGEGYREALALNGIGYRDAYVRLCEPTDRETLKASIGSNIRSLLALRDRPDALFAATDQLSTYSLKVLHELGYRIPDDIALIGFSNTEFAEMLTPPLSTVYQPAFEIGCRAAEMLVGLIHGRECREVETIMLPVRLDARESSRFKH